MITRTTPNVLIYKYCVYYIIIASPSGRLYQCCKRIIVSDVVIVVVVVPYNILNKCLYIIRPFLNALDLSNFIELVLLPPSPPSLLLRLKRFAHSVRTIRNILVFILQI